MTKAHATPIGELLTAAGLISEGQLQTVLYDQQVYDDLRVGDILETRGWLSKKTVDFFCEVFQKGIYQPNKPQLLGECLVAAQLINPQQIQNILSEQQVNHLRFGSVAVLKGYISQRTLDFFLHHLCSNKAKDSDYHQVNPRLKDSKITIEQNYHATSPQKQTITTPDEEINWI
ncbi:hypothetical protein Lepto7376_2360 [[Leptolyngbya] sp. PCC 7376]|uniref:hypothetical protein n=1 Tax=[Leptolyngbya] sp. PCC 7376 TaxID=111781 RepID=UPI00029F108D|nr:hypothetical protein [[Leptolyngbya] sp. PCC 7376]AFY38644.1 hypothetical protein Lepto7376_2360 [[Leptolyngbya] sp. PCC 7376]